MPRTKDVLRIFCIKNGSSTFLSFFELITVFVSLLVHVMHVRAVYANVAAAWTKVTFQLSNTKSAKKFK